MAGVSCVPPHGREKGLTFFIYPLAQVREICYTVAALRVSRCANDGKPPKGQPITESEDGQDWELDRDRRHWRSDLCVEGL